MSNMTEVDSLRLAMEQATEARKKAEADVHSIRFNDRSTPYEFWQAKHRLALAMEAEGTAMVRFWETWLRR